MNFGLLMVGATIGAVGVGLLVRENTDHKGTPLKGTVIGNTEFRDRYLRRHYRPRVEFTSPTTGALGIITPWASQRQKWELGSEVDLVFFESTGKARYAYKISLEASLLVATVGVLLAVWGLLSS